MTTAIDASEGTVLEIITDRTALSQACSPIGVPDDAIRQLARDMLATMYAAPGIGLAAIQVGRPVRMIVFDAGGAAAPRPEVMIDPEIMWAKKLRVEMEEGCLSIPGRRIQVSRPSDVEVSYTDLDGTRRKRSLGGMPARIVQHEMDHLDGVLMTQRS